MKKLAKVIVLMASCLAISAMADTQNAASNLKIGVINYMTVFKNVPQGQATLIKLKQDLAPKLKQLQSNQADLTASINSLEKNGSTLSKDQQAAQEAQVAQQQQAFQQQVSALRQSELQKEQSAAAIFEQDLAQATKQVAAKDHYDLIISDQAAPYYNSNLDVSQEVISVMKSLGS